MPEEETSAAAFNFADVFTLAEPEEACETKVFAFRGREWQITVRADGRERAEEFYKLTSALAEANEELREKKKFVVQNPTSGGKQIVITSPGYLGQLFVLARVSVEPAFSIDEWAVFGHKVGKDFQKVLDWASEVNGVTEYLMELYFEAAKKNEQLQALLNDGSAPSSTTALPISTHSRKPRLRTPAPKASSI